jgi:putative acetyltransferase
VSDRVGDDSLSTSVDAVGEVRVAVFEPRWRDDFARLNIEWLERWFTVEPVDREVLGDPETHVLASGGRILFAVDDRDRALGTVALMRHTDGRVELTKMAVEPDVRGAGIGRKLMAGALETFAEMGADELFLETNTRLAPAIRLYECVGFRHQPTLRPGSHYQRADVYMVWDPNGTE